MIEQFKIAIYTDEVGVDSASSKLIAQEFDVNYVILRTINNNNILRHGDDEVRSIIKDLYPLQVIGISTDIKIEQDISDQDHMDLRKKLNIIKPHMVRFGWSGEKYSKETVDKIIDLSIASNFVPLVEYEHSHFKTPVLINVDLWEELLANSKRLRIQYDPVQYVYRINTDTVGSLFKPLFSSVHLIDVRDFLIGHSAKTLGFGSIDWSTVLSKAYFDKYTGWFGVEPGLGTRYNDLYGRSDVFRLAFKAFKELLERSCQ
jgi:hypothetical protein